MPAAVDSGVAGDEREQADPVHVVCDALRRLDVSPDPAGALRELQRGAAF